MSELKIQIDTTVELAYSAYGTYKNSAGSLRAAFLRQIGEEIMNLGDALIQTACAESNLPEGRITGERGRTVGQLAKFADLVEEGSWVEATIDVGDSAREPLPKPDLRKMLVPTGPIVVFGAGNFPLAFSVAGGDTASALAGGNPVVVKGHPAHPKTGELVAGAIKIAVEKTGLPEGVFGFIQDSGYESGQLLVSHPLVKGVGFTGSPQGGMALVKIASERPEPIPVFAEMGSINPVVILEEALKERYASIAAQLVASVNQGAGQFCTNPGLVVLTRTEGFDELLVELKNEISKAAGSKMFSESVYRNYSVNSENMLAYEEVSLLAKAADSEVSGTVPPALAIVSASDFMAKPQLHEEVFGPFSLLVVCEDKAELHEVVKSFTGQLTATIQATANEMPAYREVIDDLREKCGRILFNGVPTGVEVCAAMQHGGPFPASSDSRFTSVGVSAIKRFVRPVSYQDFPQEMLPAELQDINPIGIWRTVDNEWTKKTI